MQHIAIAGIFRSAMQYASDQGNVYYLLNTGTNQLSGYCGASQFG
jgi:hypothetical protein